MESTCLSDFIHFWWNGVGTDDPFSVLLQILSMFCSIELEVFGYGSLFLSLFFLKLRVILTTYEFFFLHFCEWTQIHSWRRSRRTFWNKKIYISSLDGKRWRLCKNQEGHKKMIYFSIQNIIKRKKKKKNPFLL